MKISDIFTSKQAGSLDTVEWILRVAVATLAMIMLSVIYTLMVGLFMQDVDNKEIFSIIGPDFNTIVGAFVGLLGGLSLNSMNEKEAPLELTDVAPEPETPVTDDDDMAPWEKYRHDLRYDANGDGVVTKEDFPDWRNPEA
jgi:hypothetical protein